MAKVWEWTIVVSGVGNTEEEAWRDCEEQISVDGLGECEMDGKVVEDSEDEDACQD